MAAAPVVSAIVTSYNHEPYVEAAVRSALAQEVDGLEVIVVDDASSDGTHEVLARLGGDPRLRVEVHDRNRGVSPTFNHGLALARGEFVAYLGSDDYWLPGHLAGAVELLRREDAALCYARARVVDASDRDVGDRERLFGHAPDAHFFRELLVRSNFVPFVSTMVRRDVAVGLGGFDESLETLQDYDLWLRIGAALPVRFRDQTAVAFRWDGANASRRSLENSLRVRRELAAILERWLRERPADLRRAGAETQVRRRLAATYCRLARRLPDPAERARAYRASLGWDARQPGTLARYLASAVRAAWQGGAADGV